MTTSFGDQLPEFAAAGDISVPDRKDEPSLPEAVLRIPVNVQIVIGSVRLPLSHVTKLGPGMTLTLEERLGAPARMLVNGREVARGDLFVVDEASGRLGIAITAVASSSAEP